ncbi:hypothetical protein GCM10025858_32090 [Alicyclobacillus sacchari]|nr:hypothetical protein GCM10025858_32090 [Alicyclobacillus sacchari]
MAVANYVVDTVSNPAFLAHVRRMGAQVRRILAETYEDVTGLGLMWGFDVPDAQAWRQAAVDRGLLVTVCGPKRIRVVPPLVIDDSHVALFEDVISSIERMS